MIYLKNLTMFLRHKYYVMSGIFKFCAVLVRLALAHDLSKLMPDEFFPNAEANFGAETKNLSRAEIDKIRELAIKKHYERNGHHPEHWNGEMPATYQIEMIFDWWAAYKTYGDTVPEEWDKIAKKRFKNNFGADIDHILYLRKIVYEIIEANSSKQEEITCFQRKTSG